VAPSIIVTHTADYSAKTASVQLLGKDGIKVATASFVNFTSIYLGVKAVYVLMGTKLDQLDRNGTVTHLADTPSLGIAGTIIFSPDGSQWLWSTGGCTTPTTVHLGTLANADKVVGIYDYSSGGQEGAVPAFAWFASTGPIFVRLPCGIGGAGPFIGEAYGTNSETLNLTTALMSDFAPASCSVDRSVASDGTYACLGSDATHPMKVYRTNGTVDSLTSVQGGFVYQPASGSEYAASYSGEWPAGSYQAYSISGSQATKFGPAGMEPWGFLSDGSLFGSDFNARFWVVDKTGKAVNDVQLPTGTTIDGVLV
jgi:hypothetical protein